jgi:hypothetical protein
MTAADDLVRRGDALRALHCGGHNSNCNPCISSAIAIEAIPAVSLEPAVSEAELAEAIRVELRKAGTYDDSAAIAARVAIEKLSPNGPVRLRGGVDRAPQNQAGSLESGVAPRLGQPTMTEPHGPSKVCGTCGELHAALGLLLRDIPMGSVTPDSPRERSIPCQHHVGDIKQARAAWAKGDDELSDPDCARRDTEVGR